MDPDRRAARKMFKGIQKSFGIPKSHFSPGKSASVDSVVTKAIRGPMASNVGKSRSKRD